MTMMTGSNDAQVLKALLRTDLVAFVQKVFQTVSPGDTYRHNWHIEAICFELVQCLSGANTRLVVAQPPRSLKSICTSVAFIAWALGHDPEKKFICVSYSQDLAVALARQFRSVVTSDWYRELFPRMRLEKVSNDEITTTKGGGRIATSIGGTLTGRGADIIVIDDPLKAEDALSDPARKAVIDWYTSTLVTRLNDKNKGAIVIVMQRLHEGDLVGHVIGNDGDWRLLNLPAIATEDEIVRIGPGPLDMHRRREGDLLHPDRETETTLHGIKAEIGSLMFSAQYQQHPVPAEGNIVRREWLQWYQSAPDVGSGVQVVQSWDVAATTSESSDYSVCTTWAIDKKNYYLLDVWRGRLEAPELRRRVFALQKDYAANTVLIEKSGLGTPFFQEIRRNSPLEFPVPIGVKPENDKLSRMQVQSVRFEAGCVYLPEAAPWLSSYLTELLGFPNTKHDDQIDSTSQFLNWAGKRAEPYVGTDLPDCWPKLFIGDGCGGVRYG